MKRVILYLIEFTILNFISNHLEGQTLKKTLNKISSIDVIHPHDILFPSSLKFSENIDEQYMYFQDFKHQCDTTQLLKLLDNPNANLALFSSWALIDKHYHDLPYILQKLLTNDKKVRTQNGCVELESTISVEFYFGCKNIISNQHLFLDSLLLKLDSINLYHDCPNEFILYSTFKNGLHPKKFNNRIAYFAFEKKNSYARDYLSNWYRGDYSEDLQRSYFEELNTVGENSSYYYILVGELLKFNDKKINSEVIGILKANKSWKQNNKFSELLDSYNIYGSDQW